MRRFIGRKEYFGSLIYDRQRAEYIPFDWNATYIFEESQKYSLESIRKKLEKKITAKSFDTFIQLCQSIELFNHEGKFNGEILSNKPVEQILSAPLKAHFSITYLCELKCRHCSQNIKSSQNNELSLEEIKKLIDHLREIGVLEISLGGGDPFLRKDLIEIISYARNKGLNVSLSATGIFVSRALAKKLSELKLKSLRISFDGSTEKSYDYFRGKGTYRKAMRGIKILREVLECPLIIHSTIMKQNITELTSLLRIAQKLQANLWTIDFVKPLGGAKNFPQIFLTQEEVAGAINFLKRLRENTSLPIEIPSFPYLSKSKEIYRNFGCAGGNLTCYIDPLGNVSPCSFLNSTLGGENIREKTLKEIWLNAAGFQKMRSLSGNETCLNCEFFKACRGGCRIRGLNNKNLNTIDPYCITLALEEITQNSKVQIKF
ncbi:MAG: radical SAM protein [Armatimonadetes bacterium]|nr:radical SAM protein [Armatimonadota bacterium]